MDLNQLESVLHIRNFPQKSTNKGDISIVNIENVWVFYFLLLDRQTMFVCCGQINLKIIPFRKIKQIIEK